MHTQSFMYINDLYKSKSDCFKENLSHIFVCDPRVAHMVVLNHPTDKDSYGSLRGHRLCQKTDHLD